MPFSITWNEHGSEVSFSGQIRFEELRAADDAHYGNARFEDIVYQIYDFREADTSAVDIRRIRINAALDRASERYNRGFKVAIVAQDGHTRGLVREYAEHLEILRSSWQVRAFPTLEEAREWCDPARHNRPGAEGG